MIKCSIDDTSLKQIKNMTARVLRAHLKEHGTASALKSNMKQLIQDISEQFELTNSMAIAQAISDAATRYGVNEQIPEYFTPENISNLLIESDQNIQQIDTLGASTDQLIDVAQVRSRIDASRDFIDKSFGLAKEASIYFENMTNQNLFDCLFINRGSVNQKAGIVQNTVELNNNIRDYQNYLLKNITTYLRSIIRVAKNLKIDTEVKEALKKPVMYDENNKYTGVLETLQPLINTYIKEPLLGRTDILRQIYNDSRNSGSPDRNISKQKLAAFNSMVLLNNFDTYLSVMLGKAIQIKDFNQKTGEDKYQIAGKTAKIATTWRVSENIFVEDEADAITKLAINTSPLYNWGTDTPKDGYFLNFSAFQHIVAKIKDLSFGAEIDNIVFDNKFKRIYKGLYEQLPDDIKGKSLRALIGFIRKNPRKYLHVIFNILSNDKFKNDNPNLYKRFTQDELNKLYSLQKGIFNGPNSLRSLVFGNPSVDYYSYITESADSIFNVKYIQYYKDENGLVQVRTLLDQGINNVKRKIEQTINRNNSISLIKDWEEYKQSLNLRVFAEDHHLNAIVFKIPETDINVRVFVQSGDVQFIGSSNDILDFKKTLPFIDKTLRLNLQNNTELLNALKETFRSTNEVKNNLLKFACRIILNQYVSKEIVSDVSASEKQRVISTIYGRNAPAYNWELDELGMIHGNDIRTLYNIALAKANMVGITTSTQVKDGEGNGQSNQTLSRLLGSWFSQCELQEKNANSASHSFQLLNNTKLLEGIYTAKEFYDPSDTSKPTTKMNTNEMAYSQLVYDYIGGLMERTDNNVVGNGHIMILPSVNSDKGTIGRLLINTNTEVYIGNGISKPLKDCSSVDIQQLIALELGEFYENIYNQVIYDWYKVEDYITDQYHIDIRGLLASDFINGFENFNQIFSSLNTGFKTPVDLIKKAVLDYNKQNRLHPLGLVDQVHYKNNDGYLGINNTIIAQIARFKPESEIFAGNNKNLEYPSSQQFWTNKKAEILKGLLKKDFKINIFNSKQPELQYIKNNYKDWVNKSGNVILAKIKVNGRLVEITSKRDLIKLGLQGQYNNYIDSIASSIQLNPIIEQYNYLDYLISQEFINSSVGSFIAHPEKTGSTDVLQQEAGQFQAQHKRNVANTASMHEFQLNLLNGIPEYYNLAVIEDINDIQGVITGKNHRIKPFDGATFVNPFIVYLENYSLGGASAGISKKQFVHFKNESTGTGGMIKTAGFGLTNDWIRNSPFLETMMKKMTNHIWLNEDNSQFITDITKNWKGEKINYQKFFFKRNGKMYQITNIESLGNNTYNRTIQEVSQDGNPIGNPYIEKNIVVNTNYKLWNLFGGKNSLQLKNNKLVLSNTSVENVVLAMNSIGTPKNENVQTQDDIWQALKMVDVHYLATAGAVKQGAANINSKSKYGTKLDYNEDLEYDIQKIHMYQAGIQLDKEHHADESELSLMTQVISACAAKGYTFDTAVGLYEALRKMTDINTKEHLQAVQDLFSDGSEQSIYNFQNVLMKSIIKAISTSNGSNFAKTIAIDLMNQAKEGKNVSFAEANIPLSDNVIYRKIFSTISSFLTKSGIRQKIPGVLSVLTPSYGIMKVYNGRKYESFTNPKEELEALQEQQIPVYDINDPNSNITNIELGRTYLVTFKTNSEVKDVDGNLQTISILKTEPRLIRTPQEYKKLKEEVKDKKVTQVVEDIREGRDLAGYNVRFKTDKGEFQIWDLASTSALFSLDELEKNWTGSKDDVKSLKKIMKDTYGASLDITIENARSYLDILKVKLRRQLQNDLKNLSKTSEDIVEQYKQLCQASENTKEWYQKYTRWVNIALGRKDGDYLRLNKSNITVDASNIREVHEQVLNLLKRTQQVLIDGEYHTVDKQSIKEQAYEIIMPKTFATKFGLDEFADLNAIQNDQDYFIKQYLQNQTTKVTPEQYSVEFKKSDGNHLYVLNKKLVPDANLIKLTNIMTSTDEDGKTYRLDSNNNILYEITPDTEIYSDTLGNEVIVTDNIKHYIEELNYDSVKLSENLEDKPNLLTSICNDLKNSTNKTAKYFGKFVTSTGYNAKLIMNQNSNYHNVNLANYKEFSDTNPIIKAGREKHTSFLRSLDIVAARIPAQSMQSYMPMKVIAFDNPDINTAYVSTYQILLQGSDYDVDAVSLATFDIDFNGILQLWSPYANLTNVEMRKASEQLPIPTGETIQIQESDNIDECLYLFKKYGDLFNFTTVYTYNKETKEYIPDLNEIDVSLNVKNAQQLSKLAQFLKEIKVINMPSNQYHTKFMEALPNLTTVIKNDKQFKDLFSKIKNIIDNHNLYLDKVHRGRLSTIINNYTMMSMYGTIIDPVNLIQAQTSVDATTGPLKSIADESFEGQETKNRTPGNFVNKYQSIVENQVGKEAIAICATGLKSFFALTQYYNWVLNNGSAQEQGGLLLGNNHLGYIIGGKSYKTVTNIRSKNLNTISNSEILAALSQVNNDNDAALTLSALLSLATDNAKELSLSKLNATTKTIGMYIYGLTIGMDFKDIAKILMSPTGEVVSNLLEGDVFTGKREITQAVDVFDYFDRCPEYILSKYNIRKDLDDNNIPISPYTAFSKIFKQYQNLKNDADLNNAITQFGKSRWTLDEKLQILDSFRSEYTSPSQYAQQMYNQLIDDLQDYVINLSTVDKDTLDDMQILANGAKEMKRLGNILSLNQGIKTDPEGLLYQVNLIEHAIYDITGNEFDVIDITKFAFDEEYRKNAIAAYEQNKHSFNILAVVANVPHFMGYVRTLATALQEVSSSFKFRSAKGMALEISKKIKYNDSNKIVKGIENFVGDFLRKEWFLQNDVQVIIPKGNQAFNKDGNKYELEEDTPVKLGTDWGAATFRMFVENQVIPDLKEGKIKPNISFPGVKDNLFIKDLVNDVSTNNVSGNASIIYTLPINMMPRIDSDVVILNKYKAEFNKLAEYGYQYEINSYNSDGSSEVALSQPLPLVDLFTYYAMIANNWKLSENSLVPILEGFNDTGIIKNFHDFEKAYDMSQEQLSLDNIDESDILPYVIPKGSPYSAKSAYLWARNSTTHKYQRMKKLSSQELDSTDEDEYGNKIGVINKYEFLSSADTNYFPTGRVQSSQRVVDNSYIDDDGKRIHYQITYDIESGKILGSLAGLEQNILSGIMDYVPTIKVNGIKKINFEYLEAIIKNKLNPCQPA